MTLAPADVAPASGSAHAGRSGHGTGGLAGYAARRLLTGAGTMVFVLVFNFFLFRLLPGDPIALYTRGRNMDRDQLRELRSQLNKLASIRKKQTPLLSSGISREEAQNKAWSRS